MFHGITGMRKLVAICKMESNRPSLDPGGLEDNMATLYTNEEKVAQVVEFLAEYQIAKHYTPDYSGKKVISESTFLGWVMRYDTEGKKATAQDVGMVLGGTVCDPSLMAGRGHGEGPCACIPFGIWMRPDRGC